MWSKPMELTQKLIIESVLCDTDSHDFSLWYTILKDIDKTIEIIRVEREHRLGYVMGKGWIHSIDIYQDRYRNALGV
jgi:hypothetical protein